MLGAIATAPASSAHRQIADTLLSHHISPTFREPDSDDSALLDSIWSERPVDRPPPSPAPLSPSHPSPTAGSASSRLEPDSDGVVDEADAKSLRTGSREARAAITRTDDKLRWLLGANYQPGCQQNAVEPAAVTSKRKRRVVPSPLDTRERDTPGKPASLTSPTVASASTGSATSSRFGLAHFRTPSYASSTVPLLRHQRSVSTGRQSSGGPSGAVKSRIDRDDFPRRETTRLPGGLHRKRSLSTGQLPDSFHATRQALRTGARQGLSPVGAGISEIATRSPPSAATAETSEKPFGNLAPAFVSSFDASCAVSNRDDEAFSCNTLSEEQRRELVRRSKKLEGFFGVPFQEEAAQRVLVNSCSTTLRGDQRRATRLPGGSGADDADFSLAPTSSRGSSSVQDVQPISPRSVSPLNGPQVARSPDSRSFPLKQPAVGSGDQLAAPSMRRSSSSPSPRSPSFSSSITSGARSQSSSPPRRLSVFEREVQARERDERRKKLEKVRRFLGERVPADLVVSCDAAESIAATQEKSQRGHGKASNMHWRRGRKKVLGPAGSGGATTTYAAGSPGPIPGSWRFAQPGDFAPFGKLPRRVPSQQEASGVAALSKARKLENVSPGKTFMSRFCLSAGG